MSRNADKPAPGLWAPFWAAVRQAAAETRARRQAEGRDPETGEPLPDPS